MSTNIIGSILIVLGTVLLAIPLIRSKRNRDDDLILRKGAPKLGEDDSKYDTTIGVLKNKNFALIGLVLVGLGVFIQYLQLKEGNSSWKGFYYKSAEYPSNAVQERLMLDEASTFSFLQDCMKWGSDILKNNPRDGFECSYGCRFGEDLNSVVCEDTTKMIYLDRFIQPR